MASETIASRLSREQKIQLEHAADREGVSVAEYVRRAVLSRLGDDDGGTLSIELQPGETKRQAVRRSVDRIIRALVTDAPEATDPEAVTGLNVRSTTPAAFEVVAGAPIEKGQPLTADQRGQAVPAVEGDRVLAEALHDSQPGATLFVSPPENRDGPHTYTMADYLQ